MVSGCRKSRKMINTLLSEYAVVPAVLYAVFLFQNFDLRVDMHIVVPLVPEVGSSVKSSIFKSRDAMVEKPYKIRRV